MTSGLTDTGDQRSISGLRMLAPPFTVPTASGTAIHTRLRVTADEAAALVELGTYLGGLAGQDLAWRVRLKAGYDKDDKSERKRYLTSLSSSRWASSIFRDNDTQWRLARRSQLAHLQQLESAVATLRTKIHRPADRFHDGTKIRSGGCRSQAERYSKQQRLLVLQARLERVRADWKAGKVHIVRGSKSLLNQRHNLAVSNFTAARWQAEWTSERFSLAAKGTKGERHGNSTISISPEGRLEIALPKPLAHLANSPRNRMALASPVSFSYRGDEWLTQINSGSLSYDIRRSGRRWYLVASWATPAMPEVPLSKQSMLGLDLNRSHVSVWKISADGNPVGSPVDVGFDLTGPTSRRDAQVRHMITRILKIAKQRGVQAIAVEDLHFATGKDRESARPKWFRSMVAGFPTGMFRDRLVAMAARQGISVVAVDPAYTSKWGAQYWKRSTQVSRHQAAAVVIGRRALGYKARCRFKASPIPTRAIGIGERSKPDRPEVKRQNGPSSPSYRSQTRSERHTGHERIWTDRRPQPSAVGLDSMGPSLEAAIRLPPAPPI